MRETINKLPKQSGVYKITSPSGNVYIGESTNLYQRGKSYLNPNKIKRQTGIFNSLNKYGIDSHIFEVIEICDVNLLKERERFYQEQYDSVNNGLNCFYTKTKDKLKCHSEKTKKIMSEKSSGDKNHFYGKKHSSESLKKISESSKGEKNPNYGGKFKNEDWLKKQSDSNSKKPIKVIDTETNNFFIFKNSKECGDFLNVSHSTVRTSKSNKWKIKKRYIVEDLIVK